MLMLCFCIAYICHIELTPSPDGAVSGGCALFSVPNYTIIEQTYRVHISGGINIPKIYMAK